MARLTQILQSAVIVLSPLYIIRFSLPIFGFALPTTLLELLLLLSVCLTATVFWEDGHKFKELKTQFELPILAFLVAAAVAVVVSFDQRGGLGIFRAYFIEPVLFFYCLIFTARKAGYGFILNSILLAALWLSLLAILQKITGSFTPAPYEMIQGRVTAVYNSANSLALFVGPAAVLSFSKFFSSAKTYKYLYFCLFLLFSLVVVWTKSKGGMGAEVAALLVFGYTLFTLRNNFLQRNWFLFPAILIVVVFSASLYFYQNYDFLPPSYNTTEGKANTLQIRFFIWGGTVNMLKDHPVFGAGLNGFKELYAQKYRLPQFPQDFQYPHNIILNFWTETGLLGLFTFLYLVVRSFALAIQNIISKTRHVLSAGLMAVMVYWIVHGLVDVPYFKNDLSLEFWLIVALIQLVYED